MVKASLFASHRGRVGKRVFIGTGVFAVVAFIASNAGGDDGDNGEYVANESDYQHQIAEAPVYETGGSTNTGEETDESLDFEGEEGDEDPESDSGEGTPEEEEAQEEQEQQEQEEDEELLKSQVRSVAVNWAEEWVTYDYEDPPSYNSMPNMPTGEGTGDSEYLSNMIENYEAWVEAMEDAEEQSSGSANQVAIQEMRYSGTSDQGEGYAEVQVDLDTTISSEEIGQGGTQQSQSFLITVTRAQNVDISDSSIESNWFIEDVETVD